MYVCKPFSLAELYAKVGAVLRRFKASKEQEGNEEAGSRRRILSCGKISIDRQSLDVTVDGKKLELSPKELDLLLTFIGQFLHLFCGLIYLVRQLCSAYKSCELVYNVRFLQPADTCPCPAAIHLF